MAVIFIFIIILFLMFYVLTRVIWVRVIYEDKVIIELHLPILSLKISNDPDGGNTRKKAKKKKLSGAATLRVISAVIKRVKTSKREQRNSLKSAKKVPKTEKKRLFFSNYGNFYLISFVN